jgi:sulfite reductase (NADPH) flavoprotein alpha-component
MSSPSTIKRISPGAILQVLIGLLLASLAAALLAWQKGAFEWSHPGAQRVLGAVVVIALYVFACLAQVLRRGRMQRAGEFDIPRIESVMDQSTAPVLVIYASQTGFAEELAKQTAHVLASAGLSVDVRSIDQLDAESLTEATKALFIASTTGEGDAPDSAVRFLRNRQMQEIRLSGLNYAVLALGDSEYVNFCAFGRHLDKWLSDRGARALCEAIEVDNGEETALRRWQQQLRAMSGNAEIGTLKSADFSSWRLVERRLLNAGSAGEACLHIALEADDARALHWRAGDIAEIVPQNAASAVAQAISAAGFPATAIVDVGDGPEPIADVLARSHLPAESTIRYSDAQAFASVLKRLPHREYSIASLPSDGAIHLVVRLMRGEDGLIGIGSGWLGIHAPIGTKIALRLRNNANFHAPDDDRPLILIGNGTGIAGLRSLLKQRIASGHYRNWLVFGERHRKHDFLYGKELTAWHEAGQIEHLDLAFSRDQAYRVYVQDLLRKSAKQLRSWVEAGASIYVCGSQQGMAPGVDRVLREELGSEQVDQLIDESRYRRDVY